MKKLLIIGGIGVAGYILYQRYSQITVHSILNDYAEITYAGQTQRIYPGGTYEIGGKNVYYNNKGINYGLFIDGKKATPGIVKL